MRILQIIDSLRAGGKERQFIEVLKGLENRAGITSGAVVMSDVVHYEALEALRIPTYFLVRTQRHDLGMFLRLYKVMQEFKPDVVHSWNAMCSVYAAPVAKLLGVKFVNGFIRGAPPGLTYRDPNFLRGRLLEPFSDVILANSQAGLDAYRFSGPKCVVIRNGFDLERLENLTDPVAMRRSLGITNERVVGMVGSFSEMKDHRSFFEMALRVIQARDDVIVATVGDGRTLEEYSRKFPVGRFPRIKFLGERKDVESIVNIFSVGVLLSPRGEGIANAIMEYMALVKPVVATDCPGNRELLGNTSAGRLVAHGDVDALTCCVLRYLDDPRAAAAAGESGRVRVREEFSLDRMATDHVELYQRVLASRH